MRWAGTWATSPLAVEGQSFANQTLRMICRASIGGERLRLRFSNASGGRPLVIGAARVALRGEGAAIRPASDRGLTFGGESSAVVAAGAPLLSDPVDLSVPTLADLAVSIYLPGETPENFAPTGHGNAHQTGYISPPGDFTGAASLPVAKTTEDWFFVNAIEVLAPSDTGVVVAFGDSLTDGNLSSLDANCRWPDRLARRLVERRAKRPFAVMNHGIGGNRILHDTRGDSGLRRFDRDVLAACGATHAIVFLGINDIRNRWGRPEEVVSAAQMIAGLRQLAERGKERGIVMYGATLLPFENETFLPGAWTPERDRTRLEVNQWIRDAGAFDAVIDFDAALRDPERHARMLPEYDCGDHLHPSDRGYTAMGDAIDLALFE